MFKVKMYSVGKCKESWLQEALAEYEKRLSRKCVLEWVLTDQLPEKPFIALDPKGKVLTSEQFSKQWVDYLVNHHSRAQVLIGGPDGIPEKILKQSDWVLSLSPLTFTHQMVRLIWVEQVYRAFEIDAGSLYHRK